MYRPPILPVPQNFIFFIGNKTLLVILHTSKEKRENFFFWGGGGQAQFYSQ